jgi:hypothetical protein
VYVEAENVQYNGNAMRGNNICLLSIERKGMELVGFLFMALFWVVWVNIPVFGHRVRINLWCSKLEVK